MNEKVIVTGGASFHVNTKNVRLPHKPGAVGEAWMWIYSHNGDGFEQHQQVHMSDITLEQLELLQHMQMECARQSKDMDGGTL